MDTFDHEWQLGELLDAAQLDRFAPSLGELLGGHLAISDAAGQAVWGEAPATATRQPLILELEAIGYLSSSTASPAALRAGRTLLVAHLRSAVRFKMASTLHIEAVAADFESLKREHAHLLESEARYKTLAAQLEARVKEQVAQLEERQQMLYAAEKLASVGRLAAGMAHEINNPLGFVHSNLNTFQSYLDKFSQLRTRLNEGEAAWLALDLDFLLEDGGDLLRDSAKGLDRIARIVSDLKSFSNVDRATEEFTDLNICLQQVLSILETSLPAGITLQVALQPLPKIVCLPGHLNQLFFNILRNAVQAIEDTGHPGIIKISSGLSGGRISVSIADNGVGMTPTQLDHACEPFYTTRPVGAGAGLGLATANNIAGAHSGQLELTSTPMIGTTVTLSIPAPS